MGVPIKNHQVGKVRATVWENEWQGKKNYSVTFKKNYMDKNKEWKNSEFFTQVDLRDLCILVLGLLTKQIKSTDIKKKQEPTSEPSQESNQEPDFDDIPF